MDSPSGPIAALRLRAYRERIAESLFFVPSVMILAGAGVGLVVDAFAGNTSRGNLPSYFDIGPSAARTLLATIAGATITTVGVVFSIVVISVQLASGQFSPRIIRNFLRDWRSQVTVGVLGASFTYSVVALFSVGSRSATGVPAVATGIAALFGIGSIFAILGFVNHSARRLYVGNVADRVTRQTMNLVAHLESPSDDDPGLDGARTGDRPRRAPGSPRSEAEHVDDAHYLHGTPPDDEFVLVGNRCGWVQQVSTQAFATVLPSESVVRLETRVGAFAFEGTALARIWPPPLAADHLKDRLLEAFAIGPERTMQQDVDYGLRQISDVALRAMSPAVNDPHTAIEMVLRHGAILHRILAANLPPLVRHIGDIVVVRARDLRFPDYVDHAFDDIRRMAASQPSVAAAIIRTCRMLARAAVDSGRPELSSAPLHQVAMTLAGARDASLIPDDLAMLQRRSHQAP